MFANKLFPIAFILLSIISCERLFDGDDSYVALEYTDFMKLSNDKIADSLGTILDVDPVIYNRVVSTEVLLHESFEWAVEEGYEYISDDSGKIIVWVDEEDNPYFVTYELRRNGTSEDWSYEKESVISEFTSNIERAGADLNDSHNLTAQNVAGFGDHWYRLRLSQAYNDTALEFPYFYSETESDTNKTNCLLVSRWYLNLNDVTYTLSDQVLKETAREYFEASEQVVSVQEELTMKGYHIINDRLCKKVGSAIIDEYGSTLDLYIDIQNGEVAEESYLLMRN